MNKKQQVLDTIRNLCDLKRLERNCEVKAKNSDNIHVIIKSNEHGIETSEKGYFAEETLEWHMTEIIDRDFEIIGLPVELNHLLLALDFISNDNIQISSNFMRIEIAGGWALYNLNLSVEKNLDNPELLDLIYELICKK